MKDQKNILKKFPKAAPALEEALTLELKEGDSVFVPSFTWIQTNWNEEGIVVTHYGWVNEMGTSHLQAIDSLNQCGKYVLNIYEQLSETYQERWTKRWIAVGRHPRGVLQCPRVC
jgi:hypothetical protein